MNSHILMKFDYTKLKRKLWKFLESKNNSFAEGFPGGSAGKESTCNAGDLGSIPRLGIFPGKGIGYPLQYPWASLVAQLVENPPAMQETWFNTWVGKNPWRRESLPTPVFWPGEFHGLYSPWGCKESDMTEQLSLSNRN